MNTQALTGMSKEQLVEMIAAMQVASQRKLTCKVSAKGAVSLYGMGKFPVTLYASQWERLAGEIENVLVFIKANEPGGLITRK